MGHEMIEIEIDRYGCKRCVFPDLSIVMEKKKKKKRTEELRTTHCSFVSVCLYLHLSD